MSGNVRMKSVASSDSESRFALDENLEKVLNDVVAASKQLPEPLREQLSSYTRSSSK